jgi:SAM-dependent methyltransferase
MRNSSRTWLDREIAAFAKTVPAGGIVLDAGAGTQPYKVHFDHCTYEAADFEKVDKEYAKSTYVCDLAKIPVEDSRFDAVIFNQVMEHLPAPWAVLAELRRVLKPGGRIIATAPLFYEEHEKPYDFFRYTQFAWQKLMADAGFKVERLDWMEGYMGTSAYQLETMSKYLPRKPSTIAAGATGWLMWPVVMTCRTMFKALALLFYIADEKSRFTLKGFPKNYVVIAGKA